MMTTAILLKTRIEEFNTQLTKCLDDTNFVLASNDIDYYYQNDVFDIPLQRETENRDSLPNDGNEVLPANDNTAVGNDATHFDNLIGATFLRDPIRSPNNVATEATIIKQKTDPVGVPLGCYHLNPLLDC